MGCGCDVGTGREQGREGREMVEMMTLFALSQVSSYFSMYYIRVPGIYNTQSSTLCTIYEYLVYICVRIKGSMKFCAKIGTE